MNYHGTKIQNQIKSANNYGTEIEIQKNLVSIMVPKCRTKKNQTLPLARNITVQGSSNCALSPAHKTPSGSALLAFLWVCKNPQVRKSIMCIFDFFSNPPPFWLIATIIHHNWKNIGNFRKDKILTSGQISPAYLDAVLRIVLRGIGCQANRSNGHYKWFGQSQSSKIEEPVLRIESRVRLYRFDSEVVR